MGCNKRGSEEERERKGFFFLFSLFFNSCANKIREEGKDRKIGGRDLLKERNACTVNSR